MRESALKTLRVLVLPMAILVLGSPSYSSTVSAPIKCIYALTPTLTLTLEKTLGKLDKLMGKIYPKEPMTTPKNTPGYLQFGFESEYTSPTIGKILDYYGPRSVVERGSQSWLSQPIEVRMKFVTEDIQARSHRRESSDLVMINRNNENLFLPETLFLDDNTNLEFILKPVDTISDWYRQMKYVNQTFGLGSMQTMISAPKASFYANGIQSKLGYFTFTADLDALTKLQSGHKRYQENPEKDVARSFMHPSLGPFNSIRQEKLRRYLELGENDFKNGRDKDQARVTPQMLTEVAFKEDSFKYAGTTTYRPDIGGSQRVSVEVRDAHVSESDLISRVQRSIVFLKGADTAFGVFSNIKSFDIEADYMKLTPEVHRFLLEVIKVKLDGPDPLTESEIKVLQVYRNFAYPLRDWNPYLFAMDHKFLIPYVKLAQDNYSEKINSFAAAYTAGIISKEKALKQIQGALAAFAEESGLADAFQNYYTSQLSVALQ